jgi:hypothetical protein
MRHVVCKRKRITVKLIEAVVKNTECKANHSCSVFGIRVGVGGRTEYAYLESVVITSVSIFCIGEKCETFTVVVGSVNEISAEPVVERVLRTGKCSEMDVVNVIFCIVIERCLE